MGITFEIQTLDAVSSTNDVVKQALDQGVPEGFVVRARKQTWGYGRQGRTWESPEGGLYMSIALRPSVPLSELPTLSLVVGLSVRQALSQLVKTADVPGIFVKWPNDVVVQTDTQNPGLLKKICGISLETHGGGVCVGIGVNVFAPKQRAERFGTNIPIYLEDLGFGTEKPHSIAIENSLVAAMEDHHDVDLNALANSYDPLAYASTYENPPQTYEGPFLRRAAQLDRVARTILEALQTNYNLWVVHGFGLFADEYNAFASLNGRQLTVQDHMGGTLAKGRAEGVDTLGRLFVSTADGQVIPVSSGEAHLV